jgi:hypothetical protein
MIEALLHHLFARLMEMFGQWRAGTLPMPPARPQADRGVRTATASSRPRAKGRQRPHARTPDSALQAVTRPAKSPRAPASRRATARQPAAPAPHEPPPRARPPPKIAQATLA